MKMRYLILSFVLFVLVFLYPLTLNKSSISSLVNGNVKAYSEGDDYSKQRQTIQYIFSEFTLNFNASVTREPTGTVNYNSIINSISEVRAGLNIDFYPSLAILVSCRLAWFHRNCDPGIIGLWQVNSSDDSMTLIQGI